MKENEKKTSEQIFEMKNKYCTVFDYYLSV